MTRPALPVAWLAALLAACAGPQRSGPNYDPLWDELIACVQKKLDSGDAASPACAQKYPDVKTYGRLVRADESAGVTLRLDAQPSGAGPGDRAHFLECHLEAADFPRARALPRDERVEVKGTFEGGAVKGGKVTGVVLRPCALVRARAEADGAP